MCVILVLWGKHEPMARAPLLKDQSVFSLLEFGCASRHFDMFSGTWCHCLTYDMGSWIPLTRYSCHFDIWSKGSNEHIIIASLKFRLFTKLNWLIGDMWNQYYIMIIFVWVEIFIHVLTTTPAPALWNGFGRWGLWLGFASATAPTTSLWSSSCWFWRSWWRGRLCSRLVDIWFQVTSIGIKRFNSLLQLLISWPQQRDDLDLLWIQLRDFPHHLIY